MAVLVVLQAVLAGGFLSGYYGALNAHSVAGGAIAVALLVQTVVALVLWRRAGGPSWTVRVSLIQLVIAVALMVLGEQRVLTVHVPLAVLLTVGVVLSLMQSRRLAQFQASVEDQP